MSNSDHASSTAGVLGCEYIEVGHGIYGCTSNSMAPPTGSMIRQLPSEVVGIMGHRYSKDALLV